MRTIVAIEYRWFMAHTPRLRFCFRMTATDGVELSCGGWRLWTHGEDTYLTSKSLDGSWKVSLHRDAWWASAITGENSRRPDSVLPEGHERTMARYTPTQFIDGRRTVFAIGAFRHAMLPEMQDPREVRLEVPDRWDRLTLALVRMTERGISPSPEWTVVGNPLPLTSGRRVWLTHSIEEIPSIDEEPPAVGRMAELVQPETHDVASPGWLIKGVHIS